MFLFVELSHDDVVMYRKAGSQVLIQPVLDEVTHDCMETFLC